MEANMLTKEKIVQLLETDQRAVARALLVLNERQTSDEQASENTRYLNGRGFRPCHARMGTSMAKFFQRFGYLTPKQIEYWRKRDKTGAMRIGIYAGQLLEAAVQKAAVKIATPAQGVLKVKPSLPGLDLTALKPDETRDFGNDMEYRLVLSEQLQDVMDSDDPAIINPIAQEIDEIDEFWAKVRAKGN